MFVRTPYIIIILVTFIACGQELSTERLRADEDPGVSETNPAPSSSTETTAEAEPNYEGVTIDQIFPITGRVSAIDDDGREKAAAFEVDGYVVKIEDYIPLYLERDAKTIFRFKRRESDGYWATLVGRSHLLGPASTQIFTVVSGPGGVCCTNYSIIDISSSDPREIFHSEDFGDFRNPMEVLDADGDGIYELVQFDSCFRYFMDDCGSCSPEPRAYFKYDPRRKQYFPTPGIVQDFLKDGHRHSDEWLAEKSEQFKATGDVGIGQDIRRSALAHMVDLLYIGDETRAWTVFDTYIDDPKDEIRREIKSRLKGCKFYQAMRKR